MFTGRYLNLILYFTVALKTLFRLAKSELCLCRRSSTFTENNGPEHLQILRRPRFQLAVFLRMFVVLDNCLKVSIELVSMRAITIICCDECSLSTAVLLQL